MRRFLLIGLGALLSLLVICEAASAQTAPVFKLGFKALADQIPEVVGEPLENEAFNLANGNAEQRTTRGLMVWRKADNWTAFTNGSMTWINGPAGVQSRPNVERFAWEKDPPVAATAPPDPPVSAERPASVATQPNSPTAVPQPTTQPTVPEAPAQPRRTYDVDVKAMDDRAAGPGASAKALMVAINQEWSDQWGWKPSRPTTVYLYSDGYKFADGVSKISGEPISTRDRDFLARNVAGTAMDRDVLTGGYAVVMNLGYRWGTPSWEAETKTVLVHEYTHIMQQDVAGDAGPIWFREGMAELMAYVRVQSSPYLRSRTYFVARANNQGWLPTIPQLQANWNRIATSSSEAGQVAYGVSYLAVKFLADKIGGMPLLQVLKVTASGQEFGTALSSVTGYTVERLDSEYRATIPK